MVRTFHPRAVILVITLILGLLGSGLILMTGAPARAADCVPTGAQLANSVDDINFVDENGVVIDAPSYRENDVANLRLDYSLKQAAQGGDWFTYQLPADALGAQAVPTFDIIDPGTGAIVGCAEVSSGGLVTAVFNDQVEGKQDFSGTLRFRARIIVDHQEGQTEYPIEFEDLKTITIELGPGLAPPPADLFRKDGWLTLPVDHQYFNPQRALSWRIITPKYDTDLNNVVIVDESTDEKWSFNCAYIEANLLTERSTRIAPEGSIDRSTISMSCDPERLEIRIDRLPAGTTVTFDPIIGTIPNLVNGDYTNTATLSADEVDEWSTNTQVVTVSGSGDGSGTASPSPTPTPAPSETASPTPSESASPTPSESASPTPTPSETASPTPSPTPPETASPTPSPTPSETASPTPTPSESATPTPSESASPTPSETETATPSPSETATPTPTGTGSASPEPSTTAPEEAPAPGGGDEPNRPAPGEEPGNPAPGTNPGGDDRLPRTGAGETTAALAAGAVLLLAGGALLLLARRRAE